ncbi:hypothetical protein ACFVZH_20985 [Streptomyces sp. NPDC059534]|uniref:hypothetical protein n=1 Tax=Streptomyces sp. NPDC059534 TaxID=3346859 RepID=UPI0036A0ED66
MADPVWEDSLTYTGLELRQSDSPIVMSDGTAMGSRPGVRPGDTGLTTSLAGSTINVSAGVATLYRSGQGVYRAAMPASTSPGSVAAAHATLARIDLVYLRVWDTDVDASGLRKAEAVYLAGTAAASPVAPTPAGTQIYIPLATISVPASGGGSPSVSTAVRPVTVAPGGILPDTALASGYYTGQYRDNSSTGALERWDGTAWRPWSSATRGIAPSGYTTGTYTGQYRDNTTTLSPDRWDGSAWTTTEQPTGSVYNASASLASHASTYFAVTWTGLRSSNRTGMWSAGNPTRLVMPVPGTYLLDGVIVWPGALGSADGRGEVRVNGAAVVDGRVNIGRGSVGNASAIIGGRVIATAGGQYVEVFLNQNTGSTVNGLICNFGITRLTANTS